MRFEQHVHTCDGGACSQTRHTCQRRPGDTVYAHGEDPRDRRAPPLNLQVRGREAQVPPQAAAANHPTDHRVRPSEPASCELEFVARERTAHAAAADPLAVQHHWRHNVYSKPQPFARPREHRRARLAIAPEAEIVTDHHDAGIHLPRQELRELLTGQVTQRLAEAQQPQVIQARALEDAPALPPGGQPGRRILLLQELARHRLERQKHRRPRQAPGVLVEACEQRLMTQMNAIEGANRDYTAPLVLAQIRQSANELHWLLKSLMPKGKLYGFCPPTPVEVYVNKAPCG